MSVTASVNTVHVYLGDRSYDVAVGSGLLAEAGDRIRSLGTISKLIIVTNSTVRELYGKALASALDGVAEQHWVEIPDGERFKTIQTVTTIWDAALAARADRRSVIVALGGGVVGDIAGFAAATLLRGVRFVQIPTTLLAQVDSSVGGKTGVNTGQGKNLVGAFHQPSLVLADIDVLASLDDRNYRAGLAEVVKYGVILDEAFFATMESRTDDLVARDAALLVEVVARSVALKAQVVSEDEHETGLRRILNFGHTVGHAIERAGDYDRFLHGEAVAMGMGAAARISNQVGACDSDTPKRLARLLTALGLDASVPADLPLDVLHDAIGHDKKVTSEHVVFIICEAIGRVTERNLTPAEISAVLAAERQAGQEGNADV
ncbi:MAG: 3-dehydroquinate synthase [Hyphomicrobiaceae bacterium]